MSADKTYGIRLNLIKPIWETTVFNVFSEPSADEKECSPGQNREIIRTVKAIRGNTQPKQTLNFIKS